MTFTHEGIDFAYSAESGDGKPLVMLHGLGGSRQDAMNLLSDTEGVQLLTLDLRGHGDTDELVEERDASFHTFSEDVLAFLNHLNLRQLLLGGVSMGAATTLSAAVKEPGRFRGLVLVRPAWLDAPEPEHLRIYLKLASHLEQFGPVEGEIKFQFTPDFAAYSHRNPVAGQSLLGQFTREQAAGNADLLRGLVQDKPLVSMNELQRITCPVLVVGSQQDPTHPWRLAQKLAEALPNAQLTEVTSAYADRATHQREVRAAVQNFVAGL